jgi:plasmid replication initiation protein
MKKTEVVVKSNRLVEASYRLTLTEQQIILLAVSRAREEQKGLFADLPVRVRAQDFVKYFGTDERNVYQLLKEAMEKLFERHVVIHSIDEETNKVKVTKTRWISESSYIDGAGHIEFVFAPAVLPFVLRLDSEFTQYRLEKIGKMSSAHAVRLYELLLQYLTIGRREIEISWLREKLCLTTEYSRVLDFKKYVIDIAVEQINEFSDIKVSYEQRKTGRNITHLDFKIKVKPVKKTDKVIINREFVEKNARPGETYDQAFSRLVAEHKKG